MTKACDCPVCTAHSDAARERNRILHKIAYNRGLLVGAKSCHVNDRSEQAKSESFLDMLMRMGLAGSYSPYELYQEQEKAIMDAWERGQITSASVQSYGLPSETKDLYRFTKGHAVPPKGEPRNTSVPPILGRAMHDAKAGERVDVVIGHGQIAPKVTASQNVCKGDSLVSDLTGKVKPFRTGPKTWEGTVVSINTLSIHVRCALGVISVNHPEGERWYEGMVGTKVTIVEKDPYGWKLKQPRFRQTVWEWFHADGSKITCPYCGRQPESYERRADDVSFWDMRSGVIGGGSYGEFTCFHGHHWYELPGDVGKPRIIERGKPKAEGGIVKPKTRSEFVDMLTDEATKNPPKPFGRLYVAGKDEGTWDTDPPKETKEVEIKDMTGKPFKITLRIGGKEFVHTGTLQPMPEPEPQLWEGDQA